MVYWEPTTNKPHITLCPIIVLNPLYVFPYLIFTNTLKAVVINFQGLLQKFSDGYSWLWKDGAEITMKITMKNTSSGARLPGSFWAWPLNESLEKYSATCNLVVSQ